MASKPPSEDERIAELYALHINRASSDARLDAVCRLAARLLDVPMALFTLIDERTLWVVAGHGTDIRDIPRREAFGNQTIQVESGDALVLFDLHESERYRDHPWVRGEPHSRFYAGVPIAPRAGLNIGTLCVMDTVPRPDFGAKQVRDLKDLASFIEAHLRLQKLQIDRAADEMQFRLIAETTTDVIILANLDTTRRYVSPAARSVLGYEPEELIGTRPLDFVHPDDADRLRRDLTDVTSGLVPRGRNCYRSRRKDGRWIWIEACVSLTYDPLSGSADGYVVSLRDVCDRKEVENELRVSEERLALALDSGSDGMWDWDLAAGEVRGTRQWSSLLGYGEDEIEPRIEAWESLIHPDDAATTRRALMDHLTNATPRLETEYRVRTEDGGYVWTLARGKVVARDTRGRALRMVGTHTNITRRKEVERQLAHMARHDVLTGLPNRLVFYERLQQEISNAERHGYLFAVLACDLDGFKAVNDVLGHSAGDRLLRTVAERLRPVVREGDMVARLGGDEFAIVLGRIDHQRDATKAALRAIEAIERPVRIDGRSTSVGVSIGIAIGPKDGRDAEQLFKNADIALYRAKAAGRNTHRFYETGMDQLVAERNLLEQDMRAAIKGGGFSLDYQPIVLVASGAVIGFEALLRWDHPTRGALQPAEFVPVAEETGLIVALGAWALHEACREAATWPANLSIAVNVSAAQIQQPGLEQTVLLALGAAGLAAHRLELEITESVLVKDAEAAIACLQRLRSLGVRVALDDFGTGYSSLSYLRRFPFSKIKIDCSFIREIDDPYTAAIVRAVVGLAARVGASITAEGVETEEQLASIREEGCTEAQGFLFSKPLQAEDARDMARRSATAVAA